MHTAAPHTNQYDKCQNRQGTYILGNTEVRGNNVPWGKRGLKCTFSHCVYADLIIQ